MSDLEGYNQYLCSLVYKTSAVVSRNPMYFVKAKDILTNLDQSDRIECQHILHTNPKVLSMLTERMLKLARSMYSSNAAYGA